MALEIYRKKRRFGVTPEPRGRRGQAAGHRYVIQKHAARRLHYDLRLELDGVMKSWAVTRGPSLDPREKRLAVHVEDHPIEYNAFEGTIPEGEYGGGTVMIWDRGRWIPEGDPHQAYAKGHLTFDLDGEKLRGRWHLVRMRGRAGDRRQNWLLIKGKDDEARVDGKDVVEEKTRSVASGRSMEEIAAGKGKKRVWHSNRAARATGPAGRQSQRAFREELRAQAEKARPKAKAMVSGRGRAGAEARSNGKFTARAGAKPKARAAASTVALLRSDALPPREPAARGKRARLPDFVPPSLATLHSRPPAGSNWLHEVKFDGYRIEARLDRGRVQLLTRNRQDWTHRFAPIAEAVAVLPARSALLDGELVVEDERGVANFSLLQTDLKEGRSDRFVYWAFDLLHLDGRDLSGEPLVARKAALQRLLSGTRTGRIRCAEEFATDATALFNKACALGLEGVVSKRRDAPYRFGRSENFIKAKCHNEQEFVVVGISPSAAMSQAVGALAVAVYENGALRYAGRVGTGYTRATARDLWKRLQAMRVDKPPLLVPATERRKDVIWVRPETVVEVEYRGVTHDGLLRQASYKGLREDKPAREVVREAPVDSAPAAPPPRAPARRTKTAMARSGSSAVRSAAKGEAQVANVRLTHAGRVYWVDVGITKEDLADYYVSVWDFMAPHLVGRPLALVRCPAGTKGECFFQKHIPEIVKDSALRHVVDAKEHDVIAVEKREDLIALVQSGALEIHVRGSRLDALESCDRIVFDLDPGEGVGWKGIVAAARETRDRLTDEGLESFAKLSGGKGIHVVVPIADAGWDAAKEFAQRIALAMAADSPDRYVGKMTKALRRGKIFIDYFRNSREATSVAAYSTRARPGAPVSAPLTWEKLSRTKAANEFTVLNLKKYFRQDPWRDIGKVRQRLPKQ